MAFQGGLNRIFGTTSKAGEAPAAVKRIVCRDDPKKAIDYLSWVKPKVTTKWGL